MFFIAWVSGEAIRGGMPGEEQGGWGRDCQRISSPCGLLNFNAPKVYVDEIATLLYSNVQLT